MSTRIYKEKLCPCCERVFTPDKPNQKYCSQDCRKEARLEQVRKNLQRARAGEPVKHPNKSHSQREYKDSPLYKTGESYQKRIAGPQMKAELVACMHCGKDLSEATKGEWAIHHKDQDRTNQESENLVLLCTSCHRIEHGKNSKAQMKIWNEFERRFNEPRYARELLIDMYLDNLIAV